MALSVERCRQSENLATPLVKYWWFLIFSDGKDTLPPKRPIFEKSGQKQLYFRKKKKGSYFSHGSTTPLHNLTLMLIGRGASFFNQRPPLKLIFDSGPSDPLLAQKQPWTAHREMMTVVYTKLPQMIPARGPQTKFREILGYRLLAAGLRYP